jgi:hypothetical protein
MLELALTGSERECISGKRERILARLDSFVAAAEQFRQKIRPAAWSVSCSIHGAPRGPPYRFRSTCLPPLTFLETRRRGVSWTPRLK